MSGKGKDFRPITDTWFLAPSKVGYYGAYPNGFLQRARVLLCRITEPMLHVCSGMVHRYPGYGYGPFDKRMDLDLECDPDYLQDARDPYPEPDEYPMENKWPAILQDPPYTKEDATHYNVGADVLPTCKELLTRAWEVLRPGGRVGILHQLHPAGPSKDARLAACITVIQGQNQRARIFTVYEKEFSYERRI